MQYHRNGRVLVDTPGDLSTEDWRLDTTRLVDRLFIDTQTFSVPTSSYETLGSDWLSTRRHIHHHWKVIHETSHSSPSDESCFNIRIGVFQHQNESMCFSTLKLSFWTLRTFSEQPLPHPYYPLRGIPILRPPLFFVEFPNWCFSIFQVTFQKLLHTSGCRCTCNPPHTVLLHCFGVTCAGHQWHQWIRSM